MPEMTSRTEDRTTVSTRRRNRALTVLAAVVVAVVVWAVAALLLGLDMQAVQGGAATTVGIGSVVAASAVASLAGWALLAVLERFTPRAMTIWTVVAVLVTVLSLAGPLGNAATLAAGAPLAVMHLVVGAVVIVGFRRTAR